VASRDDLGPTSGLQVGIQDKYGYVNYLFSLKAIIVVTCREGQRIWSPRPTHLEKVWVEGARAGAQVSASHTGALVAAGYLHAFASWPPSRF
jgi:hypothetical protein